MPGFIYVDVVCPNFPNFSD